ncbi:winged helix-turn-helix domain-containing protein [Grimontia kaedaensis]|uniref:Winged helix-turn-helix domain-containing protein n=1 Tax=Grimontia kaedaensis TaxID=2872157 RepID=A0ABY4X1C6_9GAMM|nr:winged helix-turn-helix domain-containing protein [Grimontia kaedaensis]USH05022.1 winged helix-turn-helix domain-containing protein [Grimontia kaedaensis]
MPSLIREENMYRYFFDRLKKTIFNNSTGEVSKLSISESMILSHLIENKDNEVEKSDLIAAGWPMRVVGPNSLTMAIKAIRQALSDKGEIIETLPGKGYMLHSGFIQDSLDAKIGDAPNVKDSTTTPLTACENNESVECFHECEEIKSVPHKRENVIHNKKIKLTLITLIFFIYALSFFVSFVLQSHQASLECMTVDGKIVCSTSSDIGDISGLEDGEYLYGHYNGESEASFKKVE